MRESILNEANNAQLENRIMQLEKRLNEQNENNEESEIQVTVEEAKLVVLKID